MPIPDSFTLCGWVYVLSNEAMPGLYKIGMTTTDPESRAAEISHGTGVPLPYKVELAFFSNDPRSDEERIHEHLSSARINQSREFFRCSIEEINTAFIDVGLLERKSNVEALADNYQIITFDKPSKLNLRYLFEELRIEIFGNADAAAEGLIRLSALILKRQNIDGRSLVLHNGNAKMIVSELYQRYEKYLLQESEKQKNNQTYDSKQSGEF